MGSNQASEGDSGPQPGQQDGDQLDEELRGLTVLDLSRRVGDIERRQATLMADYEQRLSDLAGGANDAAVLHILAELQQLRDAVERQHRQDYERLEGTFMDVLDVWINATRAIESMADVFRGRLREPTTSG